MPVPWAVEMGVDSLGRNGGVGKGTPLPVLCGPDQPPPHSTPGALTCPCRPQA